MALATSKPCCCMETTKVQTSRRSRNSVLSFPSLEIRTDSNCKKNVLWLQKINAFTLLIKISSLSCWIKQRIPPTIKTNGLYLIFKTKSREHSSIPSLTGTAVTFEGWLYIMYFIKIIICHVVYG